MDCALIRFRGGRGLGLSEACSSSPAPPAPSARPCCARLTARRRGRPLPGARPAAAGRRARAGADRARGPRRPAVVPPRAARRGHGDPPGRRRSATSPRPRSRSSTASPPGGWSRRPSAAGVRALRVLLARSAPRAVRARFLRAKALAERAVDRVSAAPHDRRAVDHLRARRPLADAARPALAAARRCRARRPGAPCSSRSGPRTSPTASSPRSTATATRTERYRARRARHAHPRGDRAARRCGRAAAAARSCHVPQPLVRRTLNARRARGRADRLRHRRGGRAHGRLA